MFWDTEDLVKKKDARFYQAPPVPDTGWKPPTEFPNLSGAHLIGFDTETKDLTLHDEGPGWGRGKGHIVGVSLAAEDKLGNRGSWYFPVRHEFDPHLNMNPANVFGFLKDTLETPVEKVGLNLTYDMGYLSDEGINVKGPLHDISFGEALIDGDAFVSLEAQSQKYLGVGKLTDLLEDWQKVAYPHTPITHRRKDIYRSPPTLVGPYAEIDALHPMLILKKQYDELWRQGLWRVYRLECDLIPMMIAMRRRGITVDVDKAVKLLDELRIEIARLYKKIYTDFGYNLHSTSSGNLGALFDHMGLSYPRTAPTLKAPNGSPSFKKEFLASVEHPIAEIVGMIKEREKICSTFLQAYLINANVNGKLHPQFHQLKGDENGTMVGRFASSDPNLQNIPSRTKLGKRVRECFIKDEGHYCWRKFDYSQIHYRILAHNAVDDGDGSAEALRQRYINDPKTDYHMDVYRNVAPLIGWSTDYTKVDDGHGKLDWNEEIKEKRRPIKNVNFGLLYGQSEAALAYKSGLSGASAKLFFSAYFQGAPYVKPTMLHIGKEVQEFGYVTTLLGRRVRFNMFEPNNNTRVDPLPYEMALRRWGGNLKRAFEYRGVNYKFQGSEPDIMKTGMLNCWNSGVFEYTGVPVVTVHDELDFSVIDDSPRMNEAFAFIQHTMEHALTLRIPVYVDMHSGPNWGKAD